MPAKTPDAHFADYPANTRIKHEILRGYLKAYLTALSNRVEAFHYIDGFAGRGKYAGFAQGSPILALDLLGQQKLPYCVSFVEADRAEAEDLRNTITALSQGGRQLEAPLVLTGEFADHIDAVLARSILRRFRNVATFAFVDPCRAKGVRVRDVRRILAAPYGECLIFWNYDGVNRWLGAVSSGESYDSGLKDLFGDTNVLTKAIHLSEAATDPKDREQSLLRLFLEVLKTHSGATHLLPFRFDARDSNRTSHYLIHCSRHGLAFKLMKAVMSSVSVSGEPGKFEYLQHSDIGLQADLFRPEAEDAAEACVLEALTNGPCPVQMFYDTWVQRPDDYFSEADYRRLLLSLEERNLIEVLDSTGTTPRPRERRRRNKGVPTLSKDLWVRLRMKQE